MATFMPPWLDWLDWLKWDCIGAGALGKMLGVWFGFCISIVRRFFRWTLTVIKSLDLGNRQGSISSSASTDSNKFLVSGKAHQNCSFHSLDRCCMDCHHLEAGVVSCECRGRPTPHRSPSPYECRLANLIAMDLVFKAHT